jgi:hypothetical protein
MRSVDGEKLTDGGPLLRMLIRAGAKGMPELETGKSLDSDDHTQRDASH